MAENPREDRPYRQFNLSLDRKLVAEVECESIKENRSKRDIVEAALWHYIGAGCPAVGGMFSLPEHERARYVVDVVKWAVRVGCLKVEGAVLDRVEYDPTSVVAVLHLHSALAAHKPKAKPAKPAAPDDRQMDLEDYLPRKRREREGAKLLKEQEQRMLQPAPELKLGGEFDALENGLGNPATGSA